MEEKKGASSGHGGLCRIARSNCGRETADRFFESSNRQPTSIAIEQHRGHLRPSTVARLVLFVALLHAIDAGVYRCCRRPLSRAYLRCLVFPSTSRIAFEDLDGPEEDPFSVSFCSSMEWFHVLHLDMRPSGPPWGLDLGHSTTLIDPSTSVFDGRAGLACPI